MANTVLQIKRSQTQDYPNSLANGELAYSFSSDKLFIGQTDTANSAVSVEYIGGKLIVDKVANIESILSGSGNTGFNSVFVTGEATIDKLIMSTYTNNAVMFTKRSGVVDFVTGTHGSVLQIAANGVPVFSELNGGTY